MSNWGEYDEENSNEEFKYQEDTKEKNLINEAIKLVFLRKYNNLNLKENELLKIFEECNYDDKCIIEKINNYLINNSNNKKIHSKKNNNYNSRFKHYSKKNNKQYKFKKNQYYKERKVEIEYNEEQEIKNPIENNQRSISTSTTETSNSENLNLKRYYSSEIKNNNNNINNNNNNINNENNMREISPNSINKESYLPQKNSYASYLLGDCDYDYYSNKNNAHLNIENFQKKIFPHIYFDKPIDNNERINFFTKNIDDDKYQYNWDKVIEFYKSYSSSF